MNRLIAIVSAVIVAVVVGTFIVGYTFGIVHTADYIQREFEVDLEVAE